MFYGPFLKLSKCLAVYRDRSSCLDDMHSIVMILCLSSACVRSLVNEILTRDCSEYQTIIDIITSIVITSSNCILVFYVSFSKKKEFLQFLALLERLSTEMGCSYYNFDLQFTLSMTFLLADGMFEMFMGYHSENPFVAVIRYIPLTMTILVMFQFHCVMHYIWVCFKLLKKEINDTRDVFRHYNVRKQNSFLTLDTRKLLLHYDGILDIVRLANRVYGLKLLFMFLISILVTTQVLKDSLFLGFLDPNSSRISSIVGVLIHLMRALVSLSFSFVPIWACQKVTSEQKKVILDAYEMLLELPLQTYFEEHMDIYENIILFEHYVHEVVQISAADMFTIDGTKFCGVISTILSYLIIAIGFDNFHLRKFDLNPIQNTTVLID